MLAAVMLLQGCLFSASRRDGLAVAERIMEDNPDSACRIIDGISPRDLSSDEALAVYGLLRMESAYRCYKPYDADSLTDFSIRYFEKSKDIPRLARTYFYKGMTVYGSGRHDEALTCVKKAEALARSLDDNTLNHKIYEGLVMINHQARCYGMMLEYSKRSLECSRRDGRPYWLAYSLMHMANSYAYLDVYDSARVYADSLRPLLSSLPDSSAAYFYAGAGCVYHLTGDDTIAKQFFLKSIETSPEPTAYKVLADIYFKEGKHGKAEELWNTALQTDNLRLKYSIYGSMTEYYEKLGNFSAALDMARKRMKLKDEMIARREKVKIAEIQLKYDKEVVEKEMYQNVAMLLAALMFFLLIFFLFVYYHRHKVRKFHAIIDTAYGKIERFEMQVQALESTGKNVIRDMERIRAKADSLYRSLAERVSRGKSLAGEIAAGATMATWSGEDTDCFIDYYKVHSYDAVAGWEKEYKNPTPGQMAYLILVDMGYGREDLMRILGIGDSSLRSIRSRLRARRPS